MFTLKFYRRENSSGHVSHEIMTVVSAVRYDVLTYEDGNYSIAAYQKTTSDDPGTEFRVSNYEKDYANCYIENMAGKTIGHYTAIEDAPENKLKATSK